MDLETAEDFKSYLREEVVRGSSGSHKKMVGTKVSGTHTLPYFYRGTYVQTFTYKMLFLVQETFWCPPSAVDW